MENNDEVMEEVNIDDEITLDVKQENNNNNDARSKSWWKVSIETSIRVWLVSCPSLSMLSWYRWVSAIFIMKTLFV